MNQETNKKKEIITPSNKEVIVIGEQVNGNIKPSSKVGGAKK